jgi:hypothetical protein
MNYKRKDQMLTKTSALTDLIRVALPNSIRSKTHGALYHFVVVSGTRQTEEATCTKMSAVLKQWICYLASAEESGKSGHNRLIVFIL